MGLLWHFHCISNGFSIDFRFEICGGGGDPPPARQNFDFHKSSPFSGFSECELTSLKIWALNSKYSSRYSRLVLGQKKDFFCPKTRRLGMEPLIPVLWLVAKLDSLVKRWAWSRRLKTPTQSWSWKLIFCGFEVLMGATKWPNMSFQLQLWVGVLTMLTSPENPILQQSTVLSMSEPSQYRLHFTHVRLVVMIRSGTFNGKVGKLKDFIGKLPPWLSKFISFCSDF